jgi:hypothetical protein
MSPDVSVWSRVAKVTVPANAATDLVAADPASSRRSDWLGGQPERQDVAARVCGGGPLARITFLPCPPLSRRSACNGTPYDARLRQRQECYPHRGRRGAIRTDAQGVTAHHWRAASQDEQLLAEDEEFEIAISSWATPDDEQVNQQAEEGIEQSQQHRAASVGPPELPVKPLAGRLPKSQRQAGRCVSYHDRADL